MRNIPKWIIVMMTKEGFKCPHCDKEFDSKNIMSLGVRHSVRDIGKEVLFIEYFCVKCSKQTDLEFVEMNLVHLAQDVLADVEGEIADYIEKHIESKNINIEDMDQSEYDELIDEFYNLKEKEKEKKNGAYGGGGYNPEYSKDNGKKDTKKSKITQKDIKDARKKLKEIKTHEEFLLLLGMPQEEIDKYNIKKGKK